MKKIRTALFLAIACVATAASAQSAIFIGTDSNLITIMPAPNMGLRLPTDRTPPTYSYIANKMARQPDMTFSNAAYELSCIEKVPGACDQVNKALAEYDQRTMRPKPKK
jgi:hypothetical protein